MRTVKEISRLTGVSVRTLHYYDEIGLLRPTAVSQAGYRLYDDEALETLRQILFFREFDMPLKEIKAILENPDFDRDQILKSQKKMLELRKARTERLISSIEDILKGEKEMNFEVFTKQDIEEIYQAVQANLSEEQKELLTQQYGSLEQYEEHFKKEAGGEQAQKNWAKLVEWYGSREQAKEAAIHPESPEVTAAYGKRYSAVLEKLAAKIGTDVNTFEVKEIVGELDFVTKQLFRLKDASGFLLDMAQSYVNDERIASAQDKISGAGTSAYIGQAIQAFYRK